MTALLSGRGLRKSYPVQGGPPRVAVDDVDLELDEGEVLALVGESGAGKSTLARLMLRLEEPTAGELRHRGDDLLALGPAELRSRRRRLQIVFQDAARALDPRQRVGAAISEPLAVHGLLPGRRERARRAAELLEEVGLEATLAERFPHQLSGGERQRVGIARALATDPEVLVADEPVSALDAAVRGQILNLLLGLQRRRGMALLLVAHDVEVALRLADRGAVMWRGRIVEEGPARRLLQSPTHDRTAALLASGPARPGSPDGLRAGPEPGRAAGG